MQHPGQPSLPIQVCVTCLCPLQGGCITKLEQFLADHLLLMGAVGVGVACLQVSWSGGSGRDLSGAPNPSRTG